MMTNDSMKYKPCCNGRCLLGGCKTSEAGGCYCVCRLVDAINTMKDVIKGETFDLGCIYFGSKESKEKWWNGLSPEAKQKKIDFRKNEAPQILKQLEEKLKTYAIQ